MSSSQNSLLETAISPSSGGDDDNHVLFHFYGWGKTGSVANYLQEMCILVYNNFPKNDIYLVKQTRNVTLISLKNVCFKESLVSRNYCSYIQLLQVCY